MKNLIIGLIIVALLGVIVTQKIIHDQDVLSIVSLNNELEKKNNDVNKYKQAAEKAEQGNTALLVQAQECLNREATARAEADYWQDLLEKMHPRPINETEKREVPDDKTRDALFDALDRPL